MTDTTESDHRPASGWFDGEYDAIVPIEVVLRSGTGVTLRLDPEAHLDEDDTRHVLGRGRQILLFENCEDLAANVAGDEEHTLRERPAWPLVRGLRVDELTPSAGDRYDLVAVAQVLAGGPADEIADTFGDTLDLVADIAEQCALGEVEEILDPDSAFWQCAQSAAVLADVLRDPARRADLQDQWNRVLAAVETSVVWPLVSAPRRGSAAAPDDGHVLLEAVAPVETLWIGLGQHGSGYTLRERTPTMTDPDARWLMWERRLFLADTTNGLAGWVGSGAKSDLAAGMAAVPGWAALVSRSARGEVDYQPYEDNVVDLGEVADLIGPALDPDSATLVVERYWFLVGLANLIGHPELVAILDEGAPIGRFAGGTATDIANRHVDAGLRIGSENFDAVRADWEQALALLAARCEWIDQDD